MSLAKPGLSNVEGAAPQSSEKKGAELSQESSITPLLIEICREFGRTIGLQQARLLERGDHGIVNHVDDVPPGTVFGDNAVEQRLYQSQ